MSRFPIICNEEAKSIIILGSFKVLEINAILLSFPNLSFYRFDSILPSSKEIYFEEIRGKTDIYIIEDKFLIDFHEIAFHGNLWPRLDLFCVVKAQTNKICTASLGVAYPVHITKKGISFYQL